MACRDWAAKVGGGVLGRVWAFVAAFALLLGLIAMSPAPAQAASFKDVPSGQWCVLSSRIEQKEHWELSRVRTRRAHRF